MGGNMMAKKFPKIKSEDGYIVTKGIHRIVDELKIRAGNIEVYCSRRYDTLSVKMNGKPLSNVMRFIIDVDISDPRMTEVTILQAQKEEDKDE